MRSDRIREAIESASEKDGAQHLRQETIDVIMKQVMPVVQDIVEEIVLG